MEDTAPRVSRSHLPILSRAMEAVNDVAFSYVCSSQSGTLQEQLFPRPSISPVYGEGPHLDDLESSVESFVSTGELRPETD